MTPALAPREGKGPCSAVQTIRHTSVSRLHSHTTAQSAVNYGGSGRTEVIGLVPVGAPSGTVSWSSDFAIRMHGSSMFASTWKSVASSAFASKSTCPMLDIYVNTPIHTHAIRVEPIGGDQFKAVYLPRPEALDCHDQAALAQPPGAPGATACPVGTQTSCSAFTLDIRQTAHTVAELPHLHQLISACEDKKMSLNTVFLEPPANCLVKNNRWILLCQRRG